MKSHKCRLKILVGILIVLIIVIGFIISYQWTNKDVKTQTSINSSTKTMIIETSRKIERKKPTQIVTDRYTQKLDAKGNIVAVSVDGNMYIAQKGTVMADGMIITANERIIRNKKTKQ